VFMARWVVRALRNTWYRLRPAGPAQITGPRVG
jgi:hypothetical protein